MMSPREQFEFDDIIRYQVKDKDIILEVEDNNFEVILFLCGKELHRFSVQVLWDIVREALLRLDPQTFYAPGLSKRRMEALAGELYTRLFIKQRLDD